MSDYKEEDFKVFKVKYCSVCGVNYVECPKCGNNTCNGGSGEVDGGPCDICPKAYKYAERLYDT